MFPRLSPAEARALFDAGRLVPCRVALPLTGRQRKQRTVSTHRPGSRVVQVPENGGWVHRRVLEARPSQYDYHLDAPMA